MLYLRSLPCRSVNGANVWLGWGYNQGSPGSMIGTDAAFARRTTAGGFAGQQYSLTGELVGVGVRWGLVAMQQGLVLWGVHRC